MKGYKKKGYKISENDFKLIKLLQEKNTSAKEMHLILGWGASTIAKCTQFDTMSDYQNYLDGRVAKQKTLQELTPQSQTELDIAIDDWKVAFDNKLSAIDGNLVEVKNMIQSLSNNKKGFWK